MEHTITIQEERVKAEEYIDFLKRTDLGSQYPKERFEQRIAKLPKDIPVVSGVDFGHVFPIITFPVGGRVRIEAVDDPVIEFVMH